MKRGSLPPVLENNYDEKLYLEEKEGLQLTADFSDVLFLGGTGRSGTTIAGKLLSRHTEVKLSVPVEIKFLTSGNGLLDLYRDPWISRTGKFAWRRDANLHKFIKTADNKWWSRPGKKGGTTGLSVGIEREDWESLIKNLKSQIHVDRFSACQEFVRDFIDLQKGDGSYRMWIDTTPPNLMRAKELSHLLPGARFLHIIRDGRDVASSVVRETWGPTSLFDALEWWEGRMKQILDQTRPLDKQVKHVWMEDLVENTREKSLEEILQFIGLKPEKTLLEYFEKTISAASSHTGRWRKEIIDLTKFNNKYQKILARLYDRGLIPPNQR
jgi:hypothetical protein